MPATIFLTFLFVFLGAIPPPDKEFKATSDLADLWARYLLCFPGACLTAYGLILQTRQAQDTGVQQIERHLKLAAFSFVLYAMVAGLLVPPASFFPASWLNRRLLSSYAGIPPPVVGAVAGMLIAYFMIRSLEVFRLELRRALEEASRSRALTQDRERISRDLHDGILQHLYGAGLNLENALAVLPQDVSSSADLIQKAIHSLNRGMQEIRNYIFDLNWESQTDLETKLRDLLVSPSNDTPHIQFEILGSGTHKMPASVELHLYYFIQEAVSNARKHAQARNLQVTFAYNPHSLDVTIRDDGVGFVSEQAWQSNGVWQQGLKNMKRRAELLGGKFAIETAPARGTEVSLMVPLESAET
ncbi:MAG: sensor histidine kinase [Candidatus Binatia bacterium]